MSEAAKVAVSMLDFLRTGHFGSVRPGILRDELRSYLGEPEAWGPHSRKSSSVSRAGVWKYGDVEFHFSGDILWLIFADHISTLKGGGAMNLDPWVLSGNLTVEQALRNFEDASIPCRSIDWKFDDATERFRVGAGIDLIFWDAVQSSSNEKGSPPLAPGDMTFHGFSYSAEEMKTG